MVLPLKDYIQLVEWTASKLIDQKNESNMPDNLTNTLSHLNIQPINWIVGVQCFGKKQGYFVGSIKLLQQKANELKKKWLKGTTPVKSLFMPVT